MIWLYITGSLALLGLGLTASSMALWIGKLKFLKNGLNRARVIRQNRWSRSDTGFLIYSEMMANYSVKVFIAAGVFAGASLFFAPYRLHLQPLNLFLAGLFLRSIAVSAWCRIQSRVIHRELEDDETGLHGMAEIEWNQRLKRNISIAIYTLLALIAVRLGS